MIFRIPKVRKKGFAGRIWLETVRFLFPLQENPVRRSTVHETKYLYIRLRLSAARGADRQISAGRREQSKLLLCRDGRVSEGRFFEVGKYLPEGSLLVFNNTKVIRARLVFYKETGARIEIFCLEPHDPADYERAFAAKRSSEWSCIVGNLKKWKDGPLHIDFELGACSCRLSAEKVSAGEKEQIVRFRWDADLSFGQLLETLGRIPIPPYLRRESEELDNSRYQTVYSKFEGSVAAPTAGLHFTPELIESLRRAGHPTRRGDVARRGRHFPAGQNGPRGRPPGCIPSISSFRFPRSGI